MPKSKCSPSMADEPAACPPDFRCPISMELMTDPVTIATGVTYERKSIEKWFFTYKKATCPATMQPVDSFGITPNHTLKRLILSWASPPSPPPPSLPSARHDEMIALLATVESSPFKVSSLKKLRSIVEMGPETKSDFSQSGGVEVLVRIIVQILSENSDFHTFRACEEAVSVVHSLDLSNERKVFDVLSEPNSVKSIAVVLQRGSAEARFYAASMLKKMGKWADFDWGSVIQDEVILDLVKSLLELVSDEIFSKASSCAMDVLISMLESSKQSRLKAIEAGAVCVLVELLPDATHRSKCEKMLMLIKLLCECAEGRQAVADHAMAVAAVTKTMLHCSAGATKVAVKIMWLICSFHATEKVVEEMLVVGAVKKMVALLHLEGRSSTKEKVIKMFKAHGGAWRRHPCFPSDLKEYLRLG